MPQKKINQIEEGLLTDYAAKLEAVLNTVIDGIVTIDVRGHIDSFNPSAERILGYTASEVIGRNVNMLMPEPYHTNHDSYLGNYLRSGVGKIIGVGREVRAKKKNGEVFPIELGVSELLLNGERMFVGSIRDISDRKRAEEALLASNQELERFAYIASHDLQEPLRMIINFTSLIEAEYSKSLNEEARQYFTFISEAAYRMQDMIKDLLDYSRLSAEDAGFTDFDSTGQVKVAVDNLQEAIKESSAEVVLKNFPIIRANPIRFCRLMQNLIGNGLKYRKEGVRPKIIVQAEDKGDEWLFSVSDNGIGIKKEYLEQIFIIFKRLHGKHEYKGTGLGLAVCKKIVEGFEGRIWAESTFGEGATFFFTIPKMKIDEKG